MVVRDLRHPGPQPLPRWSLAGPPLGAMDNATLLTALCEVTLRTIFPERTIGRLE